MSSNVRAIAEKANVSVATVSRVINQAENVKSQTRKRVEQVMAEMGITSDELVRSTKMDARIVGILVPDLTNPFFIDVIQGIEDYSDEIGMKTIICHTRDSDKIETQFLRLLKEIHVCGIIITPASDDDDYVNNEYLNLLSKMKMPIVLVDRDVKYSKYNGVFIDNEHGAFEATKLLLDNGHRNIAFISGPSNTVSGRGRKGGYCSAFEYMDVPLREDLIYDGDFSIASGESITKKILKEHEEVTAIFAANNHMTLGCIAEVRNAGLKIPEDMAVVGFDEQNILTRIGINLTVVERPPKEMGYQAMKLMTSTLSKKREQAVEQRVILMPRVIVRGSEKFYPR